MPLRLNAFISIIHHSVPRHESQEKKTKKKITISAYRINKYYFNTIQ